MHDNYDITKFLNKNINFIFVPRGMTPILQPLYLSINRPLKMLLNINIMMHLQSLKDQKKEKVRRGKIMQWVIESWENKEIIITKVIINYFLTCGITNKLEGTKDNIFSGWDKLKADGLIE
mgnify:FL=1